MTPTHCTRRVWIAALVAICTGIGHAPAMCAGEAAPATRPAATAGGEQDASIRSRSLPLEGQQVVHVYELEPSRARFNKGNRLIKGTAGPTPGELELGDMTVTVKGDSVLVEAKPGWPTAIEMLEIKPDASAAEVQEAVAGVAARFPDDATHRVIILKQQKPDQRMADAVWSVARDIECKSIAIVFVGDPPDTKPPATEPAPQP